MNLDKFKHKTFCDGRIIMINADCLTVKNFAEENAIFVSDPPYNMNYHYNTYCDKLEENKYYDFLASVFQEKKHVIIHYHENLYKYAFNINQIPTKIVSWVYNANTPRQHRGIAFFKIKPDFSKANQEYKNLNDKRIIKRIEEGKMAKLYDWWEVQQVKNISPEKVNHPCQIPLTVMDRIIKIISNNDDLIFDPFFGSGTTAIACLHNRRRFIGCELDPVYFEEACKRVETELKQGVLF